MVTIKTLKAAALLLGLVSSCGQEIKKAETMPSFVHAEGTQLRLAGESFRFLGVNICGLANDNKVFVWDSNTLSGEHPDDYLTTVFQQLKEKGMNAVRFCAFQSYTRGGTDFSSLDRVIRYAEEYDLKLIPVLGNQWVHCPGDFYKYHSWYQAGFREPQADDILSYQEHVRQVVSRYKGSASILLWQLMNEVESKTPEGEHDPESLHSFALEMSGFVKSLDERHLVSLGTIGTGQPGTQNEHFTKLHHIPTIDIVEVHDYHHDREPWPDPPFNSVGVAYRASLAVQKPFFIGEAGIKAGCPGCVSAEERRNLLEEKIDAAISNGVDGYLLWKFGTAGEFQKDTCMADPFCFTENDPIMDMLEGFSSQPPKIASAFGSPDFYRRLP